MKLATIAAAMLMATSGRAQTVTNYATTVTSTTINGVTTVTTNKTVASVTTTVPVAASASTTPASTAPSTNSEAAALGLSPNLQQLLSGIEGVFVDASPYISNDVGDVQVVGLYNNSDTHGKLGLGLDTSIPLSQQSAIGFGGAWMNGNWFDATVNLKLGTTWSYPLIGKVYNFVSSGPDYDFQATGGESKIGAYNFAGVEKAWDLGSNWNLMAGFAVGDISQLPGITYAAGFTLSFKW